MPNGDPRDGFFYPTLTLMIDSYTLTTFKTRTKLEIEDLTVADIEDPTKCSCFIDFIKQVEEKR